jgi:hypothetical protein
MRRGRLGLGLAVLAGLALGACSSAPVIPAPSEVPLGKDTLELLAKKGMQPGSPVFVRIFKEESELEIWKQRDDGRFYHFKTYPICNWSGELGPKVVHGDKQAPEGFYNITPVLMNPNSKYYLSFNVGYPNSFDKALGRTGDSVMVHGKCRSAGCYAMTDALVEEIYGVTRGLESWATEFPAARVSIPHDGRALGADEDQQMVSVLENFEARLRPLRDISHSAEHCRVREPLRGQRHRAINAGPERPLPSVSKARDCSFYTVADGTCNRGCKR